MILDHTDWGMPIMTPSKNLCFGALNLFSLQLPADGRELKSSDRGQSEVSMVSW